MLLLSIFYSLLLIPLKYFLEHTYIGRVVCNQPKMEFWTEVILFNNREKSQLEAIEVPR